MNRRAFLAACGIAGGGLVCPSGHTDAVETVNDYPEIFPKPAPVKRVDAVPVDPSADWDEIVLYTSLQGLVNRTEPRLYLAGDATDQRWLAYYGERYGVERDTLEGVDAALERYASVAAGYVVYDPRMLDSANVAATLGALENLIPVAPRLAGRLKALGLEEKENFEGRWRDRYEAYRWALAELFPRCHARLLLAACTDRPLWPSGDIWARDYAVAHRVFAFDLSASRRDRRDRELLEEIFETASSPGCVFGWRCARCNEHEYVGLAARRGLSMLSASGVRNLSVHAAIPRAKGAYTQSHIAPEAVRTVERKIYIAFMATDGDALSSMLRLQAGRFDDSEHGELPFSWGFPPITFDLMPGVAARNFELQTAADYFVAPSSGVMYTYPRFHPAPEAYLRMTREYMEKCGQRVAYMINWDDDFYWQEIDFPEFALLLRKHLPDCIGFLRGQGESAFERQYFGGGAPYIFCGEGLHRDSDVYQTFRDFIGANPIRPLFIYCLSNHTITLGRIKAGLARLNNDEIELLRLDEFVQLADKAVRERKVPADDFYPHKSGLRRLLVEEARAAWPGARDRITTRAELARLSREEFLAKEHDPFTEAVLRKSATPPEDLVAHTAIWDSMLLAKLALNRRGIYVNAKAQAVDDFVREFQSTADADVMRELWEAWLRWSSFQPTFDEACRLARRLGALAERLNEAV